MPLGCVYLSGGIVVRQTHVGHHDGMRKRRLSTVWQILIFLRG